MKDTRLNKSISEELEINDDLEELLSNLEERDELLCTGYVCGVDASGI